MSSPVGGVIPFDRYTYSTEYQQNQSDNLTMRLSHRVKGLLHDAGITMPKGTEIKLYIDDEGAMQVDTDDRYEQQIAELVRGDEIIYNLVQRHEAEYENPSAPSDDIPTDSPENVASTPASAMLDETWDDDIDIRFRQLLEEADIIPDIITSGKSVELNVDENGRAYIAGNVANADEVNEIISNDDQLSASVQAWKERTIALSENRPDLYGSVEDAQAKTYGFTYNRYDISAHNLNIELADSQYMPEDGITWEDAANIDKYRKQVWDTILAYAKEVDAFANDSNPGFGENGYLNNLGSYGPVADLDILDYHYDKEQNRLIIDSEHNNQDQLQAMLDNDEELLAFIASGTDLMQDSLRKVEQNIFVLPPSFGNQAQPPANDNASYETSAASWMSFESTYDNEIYYSSFEEDMPEDISSLNSTDDTLDSLLDEQIDFAETMNEFRTQVVDILASGDMDAFMDVVERFVQDNVQMQLDYDLNLNQQSYIVTGDQRITLTDDEEANQQIMDQLEQMGTEYTIMEASSAISGSISFSFATAAKGLTADGGYFEKAFAFEGKFSFGGVSSSQLVLPSAVRNAYQIPSEDGSVTEDSAGTTVAGTSESTSISARMSSFFSPDSTATRIDDFLKGTMELQDFFTNDNGYNTQSNYVDSLGHAVQSGVAKAVYNYTNLPTDVYEKVSKLVETMTGQNPAADTSGNPTLHSGVMGATSGFNFMDAWQQIPGAQNAEEVPTDGLDGTTTIHQTAYQQYSVSYNADISGVAFAHPIENTVNLIAANLKQLIGSVKNNQQNHGQNQIGKSGRKSEFTEHLKELIQKRREKMQEALEARKEKSAQHKAQREDDKRTQSPLTQ